MAAIYGDAKYPERPSATALVGAVVSRICHDLVSPLGAISNGLELVGMAGETTPEHALVAESASAAKAKIGLFRLAFGGSATGQRMAVAELAALLTQRDTVGRLSCVVDATGDLPRQEAKLIALSVLCLVTALPWGGDVLICRTDSDRSSGWRLVAEAERTRPDPALWAWLSDDGTGISRNLPSAGEIHFPFLSAEAQAQSRRIQWDLDESGAEIAF